MVSKCKHVPIRRCGYADDALGSINRRHWPSWIRQCLALLIIMGFNILLAACQPPSEPTVPKVPNARMLPHQAYVWQRVWQAPLAQALQSSTNLIQAWRVLAAHSDAKGRLRNITIVPSMLQASGRPVIAVVRIDSPLAQFDTQYLQQSILELCGAWRAAGLPLAGLEIDYDSSLANLPEYAGFLQQLKTALHVQKLPLSITALPAWLEADELDLLLTEVDQVVLQLHGLDLQHRRLFDPQQAQRWVASFAQRSKKPFWLALPNYGSRLHFNQYHQLSAVENEMPLGKEDGKSLELIVKPQQVAAFLQWLKQFPSPQLQGVAWFRLPTSQDQRAWSLPTWHAVIQGQSLDEKLSVQMEPRSATEFDVVLINEGEIDAAMPARISVFGACHSNNTSSGASINYKNNELMIADQQENRFLLIQASLLRAGKKLRIASLQCASNVVPHLQVFN